MPGLSLRNTLREGLAIPKVLVNPLRPALSRKDIGRGRPAMVIPGLLTGDLSTSFLRRSLTRAGFAAHGWGQGIDIGADPDKLGALEQRLASLQRESGRKVILIGWSMGGLYARVLAQRLPEAVELVMTVASPFSGDRHANRAWRLYELINDHTVDAPPFRENPARKPPVPTIAIWSGVDGIVSPACARGTEEESDYRVRVDAQHFALGSSPECVARVIDILADHLG